MIVYFLQHPLDPLLAMASILAACFPAVVRLWPRNDRLDLVRCSRCGKPTHDLLYHARRCTGAPKELRVGSFTRRRW